MDLLQEWAYNAGFDNAINPFTLRNPATSREIASRIFEQIKEDAPECRFALTNFWSNASFFLVEKSCPGSGIE